MDGGPTVEETTRDNLTSTKVSQRKRLWSYLGHPCNGNHNLSGEDWLMPALWSLSINAENNRSMSENIQQRLPKFFQGSGI